MDGYVIQLVPDEDSLPTTFLSEGDAALEDLNQANLFPDISLARIKAGEMQSQYTSYAVNVLPASKGITLKSNVAASPTNTANATV